MRKRLRPQPRSAKKGHRCFCKPNKTGLECRWNHIDFAKLKEFEKEKHGYKNV